MHLSPAERDRLLIFTVAESARQRLARGLRLNVPEATALVASAVIEAARDGCGLQEAVAAGRRILRPDQVLPGVADVVQQIHVEAVFDDGTRLAVVNAPFGTATDSGPGSLLGAGQAPPGAPGPEVVITVTNTAPVPICVTSHFHFFETNPRLRFDRAAAYGMRLAAAAGTAVRFDPGSTTEVGLTPLGGERIVIGFAGLVDGPLDAPGARERALAAARACGYLDSGA